MRPLDFPLLADENIHPDVVATLKAAGKDVRTVQDEGLLGSGDTSILKRAFQQHRVVITHDSDFGMLALYANEPHIGIIYLRPGHVSWTFVMEIVAAIESTIATVQTPFLLVAERRGDAVRIRLRNTEG
jgi:predicted nuclease of predicted toxin-antitoxin system